MEEIPLPEGMLKTNRCQYWFWMISITVVAFLYGAINYFYAYAKYINDDSAAYEKALKFFTFIFLA